MNNNSKEIILFGTGRSGTTILMDAIFRHKDLAYFSNYLEKKPSLISLNYFRYLFDNNLFQIYGKKKQLYKVNLINKYIFKPSEAYPVWTYLTKDEFDFSRDFLLEKKWSNELLQLIANYSNKIVASQNRKRLALKITGPSRLKFLHDVYPNAQFIYLERNFISTLSSFLKVGFWQERKTGKIWWKNGYSKKELEVLDSVKNDALVFTALQLQKIIEVSRQEIITLPINVKTIKYEELCENSFQILEDILNWLEIPMDENCFNYLKNNKMVNRNRPKEEYFTPDELKRLGEYIKPVFLLE